MTRPDFEYALRVAADHLQTQGGFAIQFNVGNLQEITDSLHHIASAIECLATAVEDLNE